MEFPIFIILTFGDCCGITITFNQNLFKSWVFMWKERKRVNDHCLVTL